MIGSDTQTPGDGDIVIEYHPHGERVRRILSPEIFKETLNPRSTCANVGPMEEPWRPFSSREDFEFAELVHDAKLNRERTERMIRLIRRCQEEPGLFTLKNYNDLKAVSERAHKLLTGVC